MGTPTEATGRQWKIVLPVGALLMVVGGLIASALGFFGVFFTAGAAITIVATVRAWLRSG